MVMKGISPPSGRKYTDDQIDAHIGDGVFAPLTMTGDSDTAGSISFPNGLKMMWGKTGVIGTSASVDVTHNMTKCFQALITVYASSGNIGYATRVTVIDDIKFTIENMDGTFTVSCRYYAIGR